MATWRCLILAAALPLTAVADDKQPQHYQYKDRSSGGIIRESEVAHVPYPYDKTYAEMTPAERQVIRNAYENLGPDDEPPFPKYGTRLILEHVSAEQGEHWIEGIVTIGVLVGADGKAKGVTIYETPDRSFSRIIAGILVREPYKPGLCKGQPCDMEYPFHFKFTTDSHGKRSHRKPSSP